MKRQILSHYDTVEIITGEMTNEGYEALQSQTQTAFFASSDCKFILTRGFLIRESIRSQILIRDNHNLIQFPINETYDIKTTRLVLIEKIIQKGKINRI